MELNFYNHTGCRARVEFQPVCALCGNSPEESAHVQGSLPVSDTQGRVPLPLCQSCVAAGKKPVLVKRANNVNAQLGRIQQKDVARARAKEARAATAAAAAASARGVTPPPGAKKRSHHARRDAATEPVAKKPASDLRKYLSPAHRGGD
jgi:hypothetical protein